MKAVYAACAIAAAALAGSAYFFKGLLLPATSRPPVVEQPATLALPPGAILIPTGDDTCRMHALDNATGQIMNYGVVKCANASRENLDAWRRTMNADRFVEIGKSFRHEDRP